MTMLNYQEYEKAVYEKLLKKREGDNDFNFSVRRKAAKGAEKDFFIGTEKSGYFGTTLWNIKIGFPGSSSDLIDVFFFYLDSSKYGYYIEFNQTKKPHNDQNRSALELIKNLEPKIEAKIGLEKGSKADKKMFNFKTQRRKPAYDSIDELMVDVFKDLEIIIPLVDEEIERIKIKNPEFIASHWSDEQFTEMQDSLKRRVEKYQSIAESNPVKEVHTSNTISKKSLEPINQILFGPPGTGKTYNTINKALEILGIDFSEMSRNEITNEFRSKIKQGQIVFTTFHQSMSYEEFVEGIKPNIPDDEEINENNKASNIEYVVKPGIFKSICEKAKSSLSTPYLFEELWSEFYKTISSAKDVKFTSVTSELTFESTHSNEDRIGVRFKKSWDPEEPRGTKVFFVTKNMVQRIFDNKVDGSGENTNAWQEIKSLTGGGRATTHYAVYRSFYNFIIEKGKIDSQKQNYILIIDEINRGNVSQIFGELITLIEKDKRLGEREAIEVTLPYSKETFGVPSNLYIIGTMNTADRSVEALDTALRRRFSFTEMPPEPELLNPKEMILRLWNQDEYLKSNWADEEYRKTADALYELLGIDPEFEEQYYSEEEVNDEEIEPWTLEDIDEIDLEDFNGINLEELLNVINKRIEVLLDKDHLIGHSFFMKVGSLEDLKAAFSKEIIPLLQEYFFGDYGKISLVLGEGFCKGTNVSDTNHKGLFAKVSSGYDDSIYSDKIIYTISDPQEMENEDFLKAIQMLFNQ